jgi:hypothetical protein
MNEKKKAGQLIVEHEQKQIMLEDDVREYRKAMEPHVLQDLYKKVAEAQKHDIYANKDFYVVMLFGPQRVLRHPQRIILVRQSCPTPVYKQTVWKYNHLSGTLQFLWQLPDMFQYYEIVNNQHRYLMDKNRKEIAQFVILDHTGELLKWVKKENGNKIDAVIKITPPQEEQECLMS